MAKLNHILLCLILLVGAGTAADQVERKIARREEPQYPEIARKLNLHGMVRLKIWINSDGTVRRLEYVGGHPLLAESALKAPSIHHSDSDIVRSGGPNSTGFDQVAPPSFDDVKYVLAGSIEYPTTRPGDVAWM